MTKINNASSRMEKSQKSDSAQPSKASSSPKSSSDSRKSTSDSKASKRSTPSKSATTSKSSTASKSSKASQASKSAAVAKASHPSKPSKPTRSGREREMKNPQNLRELFILELQDLRSAEQAIIKLLPKVKDKVGHVELAKAISQHFQETKHHLQLVEEILTLEKANVSKECFAIEGLCEEVEEALEFSSPETVRDAAIIGCLQRIEHYEMAGYGTVVEFAKLLDESRYQSKLEEILNQEKNADKSLTTIARGAWLRVGINDKANREPATLAKDEIPEFALIDVKFDHHKQMKS